MYVLDVAAYNAYVLMRLKDPDYLAEKSNRKRRLSLEELSISIIKASISQRLVNLLIIEETKYYYGFKFILS